MRCEAPVSCSYCTLHWNLLGLTGGSNKLGQCQLKHNNPIEVSKLTTSKKNQTKHLQIRRNSNNLLENDNVYKVLN